jgi:hypothetical protein
VEVYPYPQLRAAGLAHGREPSDRRVDLGGRVHVVELLRGIHLHRSEPRRALRLRRLRRVRGPVTPDPVIYPHLLAGRPAQKLVDRHTQSPALYVPEGLLYTGKGAGQHRSSPVEAPAIEHLEVVLYAEWVLSHEVARHLLYRGPHGLRPPFDDGFTPTRDALVGRDLQEQPSWRNLKHFQRDDLHASLPFSPSTRPQLLPAPILALSPRLRQPLNPKS